MVVSGLTDNDPDVAPPVEKFVPVQEVALVEDHERVAEVPCAIDAGFAVRVAVGAGCEATVTVALSLVENAGTYPTSGYQT